MKRNAPLYGLFEKQGNNWVRLFPSLAYYRKTAIGKFQNHLLGSALGYSVNERKLKIVGHSL